MGKENAINNISAGTEPSRSVWHIISVADKLVESVYIQTKSWKIVGWIIPILFLWYITLRLYKTGRLRIAIILCFYIFRFLFFSTETNASPIKTKGWSSTSIVGNCSDDDSEEEMSVFKQPGKKRKMNKSRYFVSGLRTILEYVLRTIFFYAFYNIYCPQDESNGKIGRPNDNSIMTNDSSFDNSLITEDEDENTDVQTGNNLPKKSK